MSVSAAKTDQPLRIAILLIATILGFAALKLGQDFFAPLVLALVTGVILGPLTDKLQRIGLPITLAAVSVLILGMLLLAALAILAEPLIWRVVDELPKLKWEVRNIIDEFRGVIRGLDEVNKEVEEVLGAISETNGAVASAEDNAIPTLSDALFFAPVVVAHFLIFAGSLFFFLLTRHGIYSWLSRFVGGRNEVVIKERLRWSEKLVSRYVLTISVINVGLGLALGTMLWLIGMPAPFVWGAVATLLNFVLYLGPLVLTFSLFLAGLVAFNGVMVFLPPIIFLILNVTESQLVTPGLIGRHMSVNPLLIFVSLLFWLWLWGPIGGIIAIPILVIALVMLDLFDDLPEEANATLPPDATP